MLIINILGQSCLLRNKTKIQLEKDPKQQDREEEKKTYRLAQLFALNILPQRFPLI